MRIAAKFKLNQGGVWQVETRTEKPCDLTGEVIWVSIHRGKDARQVLLKSKLGGSETDGGYLGKYAYTRRF